MAAKQLWRAVVIGMALTGLPLIAACDRKPAASSSAIETYTTRGRVEGVVKHPGTAPMVRVHHESIPEFKDRAGKTIGMKEMVMEFPAGTGVSIDALKSGDLVRIEFAVDWEKTPYHYATSITLLPAGTTLNLGKFEDSAGTK